MIKANELEFVRSILKSSGLDFKPLEDEILDHYCLIIEERMLAGESFEESFKSALEIFPLSEIQTIQEQILELTDMKRSYSLRESLIYSVQFIVIGLMGFALSSNLFPQFLQNLFIWGSIIGMFILLGSGWVMNFPRWSLPSIGFCLIFSLYMTNVSIPLLTDGRLLGFTALLPLLATIIISFTLKPGFEPFKKLQSKIADEPGLILFVFYGFMPFFTLLIFDEVAFPKLLYMVFPIMIISTGAFMFYSSKVKLYRLMSLIIAIITSMLISIDYLF